jgi:hypothetical protein
LRQTSTLSVRSGRSLGAAKGEEFKGSSDHEDLDSAALNKSGDLNLSGSEDGEHNDKVGELISTSPLHFAKTITPDSMNMLAKNKSLADNINKTKLTGPPAKGSLLEEIERHSSNSSSRANLSKQFTGMIGPQTDGKGGSQNIDSNIFNMDDSIKDMKSVDMISITSDSTVEKNASVKLLNSQ